MLFLALTLLAASSVTCTINNGLVAKSILDKAIVLEDGEYRLTNVQTGDWLTYNGDAGRQFYPTPNLKEASAFQFTSNKAGRWSQIATTSDPQFCPSQQWFYADDKSNIISGNWLAALYQCCM